MPTMPSPFRSLGNAAGVQSGIVTQIHPRRRSGVHPLRSAVPDYEERRVADADESLIHCQPIPRRNGRCRMGWFEIAISVALSVALSIGLTLFVNAKRGGLKKTAVLIILGAVLVFVGVSVMAAFR